MREPFKPRCRSLRCHAVSQPAYRRAPRRRLRIARPRLASRPSFALTRFGTFATTRRALLDRDDHGDRRRAGREPPGHGPPRRRPPLRLRRRPEDAGRDRRQDRRLRQRPADQATLAELARRTARRGQARRVHRRTRGGRASKARSSSRARRPSTASRSATARATSTARGPPGARASTRSTTPGSPSSPSRAEAAAAAAEAAGASDAPLMLLIVVIVALLLAARARGRVVRSVMRPVARSAPPASAQRARLQDLRDGLDAVADGDLTRRGRAVTTPIEVTSDRRDRPALETFNEMLGKAQGSIDELQRDARAARPR